MTPDARLSTWVVSGFECVRVLENAMAFQPVIGTAEVDIRGTLNGQLVENTIFLHVGDAWTPELLASAASIVRDWWFASIMPALPTAYVFREVFVKDLTTAAGLEASDAIGFGIQGTDSRAVLPGNATLAVSFRTGLAGRSFRGRNFVPGMTVGDVEGNTVTTGFAGEMSSGYAGLLTALVDSDFTWVVVSRVTEGAIRATGLTTPVIAVAITDLLVDSMRRRLTGRGS